MRSLAAIAMFLLTSLVSTTLPSSSSSSSSSRVTAAGQFRNCNKLPLPAPATGPESLAFDGAGGGPYTGVSDGRVLRWKPEARLWEEFAVPPWPQDRPERCNGLFGTLQESPCGRPLGLKFHRATGDLYIADAYFGLLVAGPGGGVATQVAAEVDGGPFRFTNGVDIHQEGGVVYFTDSSTRYHRRDYLLAILTGDSTGRLLRYDPKTKEEVAVLLRDLAFPNGVAVSPDGASLFVAETTHCRLLRYWLLGPKAGTLEVFADLPAYPDNIKWNSSGELWVAFNFGNLRGLIGFGCPVAARVGEDGGVVDVVEDCGMVGAVSEVEERDGRLWLGSVAQTSVQVCDVNGDPS